VIRIFFMTFPYLVWGLLLLCFVRPLALGWRRGAALALLLLVMLQKFVLHHLAGGDAFSPDLPSFVVNLAGWLYAIAMLICLQSVLVTVAVGLRRLFGVSTSVSSRRRWAVVIFLIAFVLASWGMWEGMCVPAVRSVHVVLKGLPIAFEGFRIVQLSDLHCSSSARAARTRGIVSRVNDLKPDLVCITGDIVDGKPARREEDVQPLRELKAGKGVFACLGNHEYYHDYAAWTAIYRGLGIHLLENEHVLIRRGQDAFALGGITDSTAYSPHHAGTSPVPDLTATFAGAPEGIVRILLQHKPFLPMSCPQDHSVSLQLSGHTHGGAIWGLDLLVRHLNHGYLRGLYREGDFLCYVSRGTGQWAGFPLRLGAPAEITEIILHASSSNP